MSNVKFVKCRKLSRRNIPTMIYMYRRVFGVKLQYLFVKLTAAM